MMKVNCSPEFRENYESIVQRTNIRAAEEKAKGKERVGTKYFLITTLL